MSLNSTAIEWCDHTWSPVTGCEHGCVYCYARKLAETRLRGRCGYPAERPFRPTFHPNRLDAPQRARRPSRIFAVSMGDLFGQWVPDVWIESVFTAMRAAPQHTFQTLTKAPSNMVGRGFPTNCWAGITAETPARLARRLPHLLRVDAPIRFASLEPIMERFTCEDLAGLDWCIVGCMTGTDAPPVDQSAVTATVESCRSMGIRVFVKGNTGLSWPREFPTNVGAG